MRNKVFVAYFGHIYINKHSLWTTYRLSSPKLTQLEENLDIILGFSSISEERTFLASFFAIKALDAQTARKLM